LKGLKEGRKFQRTGWNGKGLYVELHCFALTPEDKSAETLPYLEMVYPPYQEGFGNPPSTDKICLGSPLYPNGARVPWLASQIDILADDWQLAE
jgi:hypothetical protein